MKPHPRIRKTIKWVGTATFWIMFMWWGWNSPHPGTVWERQVQILPLIGVGLIAAIAWHLDARVARRARSESGA